MSKKIERPKPHIFDELKGEIVSVLIDHPRPFSNLKESYVGVLMGRRDGFLCLGTTLREGSKLRNVYIREDQVLSIWVYND